MKNYYQLYITKSLGVYDPIDDFCICSASSLIGIFKKFNIWKKNKDTIEKYHISEYDRFIFFEEKNAVAIDFGDYSYFAYLTSTDNDNVIEDVVNYLKGNE